jgi:hypothetical protein
MVFQGSNDQNPAKQQLQELNRRVADGKPAT